MKESDELSSSPPKLLPCQVDLLMEVLYRAFIFLRAPGYEYFYRGQSFYDLRVLSRIRDRSVAFAEALHNLPNLMLTGRLDLGWLRDDIEHFGWNGPAYARGQTDAPFRELLHLGMLVEEAMRAGNEDIPSEMRD